MTPIQLPPDVVEGPAYGTEEWKNARRGLVTASRFGDVMTDPRSKAAKEAGELSDTAKSYLMELVASTITGIDRVGGKSAAMERGVDMEADAIDAYAAMKFCTVETGRLLIWPKFGIAATPDGFVEDDEEGPGIIEVKCPESKRHLETWFTREVPEDYIEQVQGQLWVSDRQWCDFISYDDRFPLAMRLVVIRVYRDEDAEQVLEAKVQDFAQRVRDKVAQVHAFLASCAPSEARTVTDALQDSLEDVVSHPEATE